MHSNDLTSGSVASSLELNPLQIELERYLRAKSPEAANIYLGALMVLGQDQNPDKVALSAHGFRQLMKKLPNFINTLLEEANDPTLGHLADGLTSQWERLDVSAKFANKTLLADEKTVTKIIRHTADLIIRNKKIQDSRKAQAAVVIRHRYFSEAVLPEHIEKIKIKEWKSFLQSFNNTSHHNSTTEEEFRKTTLEFETYLLTFFKPQTFAVQSEIEKAILEAEKS